MTNEFSLAQLSLITINLRKTSIQNLEEKEEIQDVYDLDIELEIITKPESEDIGLIHRVKIFMGDETESVMVGNFEIEYIFLYSGLKELILGKEEETKHSYEKLKKEMNDIAYSTTRGIISVQSRGTCFESLILPIMTY